MNTFNQRFTPRAPILQQSPTLGTNYTLGQNPTGGGQSAWWDWTNRFRNFSSQPTMSSEGVFQGQAGGIRAQGGMPNGGAIGGQGPLGNLSAMQAILRKRKPLGQGMSGIDDPVQAFSAG